jgi:hypothetical protein
VITCHACRVISNKCEHIYIFLQIISANSSHGF